MATVTDRPAVGLRSARGAILAALMLSIGLIAIDSTIIATAVPSVVADLGGLTQFPWLFSVYLLAQSVSVPIYSKLADQYGRKPIILVGIALFLVGSLLCGAAWSMPTLIAFRAVQGLGAGAIAPTVLTIVGDLYSLEERGRVQGYFASVWAVASVVGPALGGVFAEYLSWRWIFFVNLPLCLAAGATLVRAFRERLTPQRHRLDYAGAALLMVGGTLVLLGLLEGGHGWAWRSWTSAAVLGSGAVLIAVFVFVERAAAEPVLPGWVFRRRVLASTSAVAALLGALLIGLTSYVPTFVQGVLGAGPLVAGFALAPLTLGWPLTSSFSARLYLRIGFRATGLIGAVLVVGGTAPLTHVGPATSIPAVAAACFVVGAGLGLIAAPMLIAAQTTVGWGERGVATGTNAFSRSIGSAVGVAVLGALANTQLTVQPPTPAALDAAAHLVFVGVLVAAGLMLVAITTLPRVITPATESAPPVPSSATANT
jgi:EmrB/QacA subfamily drug resistance transporter